MDLMARILNGSLTRAVAVISGRSLDGLRGQRPTGSLNMVENQMENITKEEHKAKAKGGKSGKYPGRQARAKEAAQRSIQKIRDTVVLTVAALINQQRQPHYRLAISRHAHFPTASRLKENEGRDLLTLSKVTA
ncbi:Uncharacterized protein DBV15_06113 [Temnothorax longispinosus]|uniref:Uncharacterized protein n=1 Tax=Temnothorax longispinosus TaxID=300112 RepID=A0A4S2KH36_9HYME|nr:Uncharacterized protein DBV15_06113 [Temnothorax longispinosus]